MPKLDHLRSRVTLADGGWSTILVARGLAPGKPAEAATIEQHELVLDLARDYLTAGARFLTTNTFSANRIAAEARGIRLDLAALNREAARLLRHVAPPEVEVAGSIGPSGRIFAVGEVSRDELQQAFAQQAQALADGGANLILLETFSELAEALIALESVRAAVSLPVVASMSFDSGPQRTQTHMRAEAADCAAALEAHGADAVGLNCGVGPELALPAVVALRANTKLPLWVRPNAGLPDLDRGRPVYRIGPDEFAPAMQTLVEAGAEVIGGCCGVGPDCIRRLAPLATRRPAKVTGSGRTREA